MPRKASARPKKAAGQKQPAKKHAADKPVRLKELADHLGLNPSTISVVLNDTPGRSIPEETRRRIKAAAQEFNYRPNLLARSFRNQRTLTVGILVPELNAGYHTEIMSGIGDYLMGAGYFYFTAHHRHHPDLVAEYSKLLIDRGAEGLICIDTAIEHPFAVPCVAVAGHKTLTGVTNVVLDHMLAARHTLTHLHSLGHRRIAFMHGQPFSSDSDDRWRCIEKICLELNIEIRPELTIYLDKDVSSPDLGYPVVQQLLAQKSCFTALVCFNDVAAIGAIRAIRDNGLRVPEDISVIGFDDIKAAAYTTPALTTIRQPLAKMGTFAAQSIVNRLNQTEDFRPEVAFEPELVVRESTAAVSARADGNGRQAPAAANRAPAAANRKKSAKN